MDKPTGPRTLTLNANAPKDDLCDLAKGSFNSARRGKLAYQALTFAFAVALVGMAIFAVMSFNDDEQAKGILSLVVSAGALATTGFLGLLAKSAKEDEVAMWSRVEKSCGAGG
jgi:hypothetical protein